MGKKLIAITPAPSITTMSYLVGVLDNGNGTGNDYRFSFAQVIAYVSTINKLTITAGVGYTVGNSGASLTGPFFSNPLSEIVTNKSSYIIDVDFSQDVPSQTIEWLEGDVFVTGQTLIAKI